MNCDKKIGKQFYVAENETPRSIEKEDVICRVVWISGNVRQDHKLID